MRHCAAFFDDNWPLTGCQESESALPPLIQWPLFTFWLARTGLLEASRVGPNPIHVLWRSRCDGLRALLARDRAVESWLHQQVGPAYDALKAEPSRAVTVDQVRARLAAEHAKAR